MSASSCLRLERPVWNLLGERRVPGEEGSRPQVAVLAEHVSLCVMLVVAVAPPRGGPALEEALEEVLQEEGVPHPPLAVPAHVLQEAALRPAAAEPDPAQHRRVRRAGDARDDGSDDGETVDARGDGARLKEAALAPRRHQPRHLGNVLLRLLRHVGGVDLLGRQRLEHLPRALVVAVELLERARRVHAIEELDDVPTRVAEL